MDDAIRKALKKKRELESELRRIRTFIETYEELTGTTVIQDEMISEPDESQNSSVLSTTGIKRRIILPSPAKIAKVSADLIREAGRPLKRGEILERLEARGIRITSRDKGKYLGTVLWRNREIFENIEGQGYSLRELDDP
ncbi:hypothetical protein [Agrobacterium sp. 22117]|uniref:hypothetical protein n=1 Tax=Agrobacterium sp. 22117 TaxID=3453880 RepID=UPI003F856A61